MSHEEEYKIGGAARCTKTTEERIRLHKRGHRGIVSMDPEAQMQNVTTFSADFIAPKRPGVRLQGIKGELLEKHIAQMISKKIQAGHKPTPHNIEYCSTTHRDFCVEGFVPIIPKPTQVHDYKTDQPITFWSENCQLVQGVTAIKSLKTPFRKSAFFSTPISERLDEIDLPPDN